MFRNLQLGSNLSLGECLQMEYRLALRLIAGKNFNEGILVFYLTNRIPVLKFFEPFLNFDFE